MYTPKLSHAILTAALGIASLVYGGINLSGLAMTGTSLFGFLMIGYSIAIMYWVGRREYIELVQAWTAFADQLSRLDADQWQVLGIRFPVLRIHWQGKPVQLFEDTGVRLEYFIQFMDNSNAKYVSPERNWANGPRRRTWQQLMTWLETNNFVYPDSASGNRSWLWRGNAYDILRERYMYSNAKVAEMPEAEDFARAVASE